MQKRAELLRLHLLRAIADTGGAVGSLKLRQMIAVQGIVMEPRAIRLHLRKLDEDGLTEMVSRRAGRRVTAAGRQFLAHHGASGRVGLISVRLEDLAVRLALDGHENVLAANLAILPRSYMARAMEDMKPVFARRLGVGTLIAGGVEGHALGGVEVPEGHVALATPCSVCLAGAFLRAGVPASLRFGGLLEIAEGRPRRFVEVIEYRGSSLDPVALFIRARLTSVRRCSLEGNGIIGASFREIPSASADAARKLAQHLERTHLWGILAIGDPGRPLLDIPVGEGRCGLVLAAGLNPFAALLEVRRDIELRPAAGMLPRSQFLPFEAFRSRWPG